MAPAALTDRLAAWLATSPGLVRVAVDGAPAADPDGFASALVAALPALGRPAVHVRSTFFWHDASLRFEHGREDAEAYREWVDVDALRREVLDAAAQGRYLPTLRDPATNRSTRAAPADITADTVLIVSGALLLGRALPFDRTVHIALSPAALRRRTPAEAQWTLAAFDGYGATVQPASTADVVIKCDDARHPAVRCSSG